MTNKLIRKKPNRLLTGRNNYFGGGGVAGSVSPISKVPRLPGVSSKPIPTTIPIPDLLKKKTSTSSSIDWGSIGSTAISTAGGIGGSLISGGLQSGAGNVLSGLGSMASAIPGGAAIGAGFLLAGGLFNRAFGSQLNEENIAQVEDNIKALNNFQSNASDFDTLSLNWANADTAMAFSDSFIGKNGWFNNDATDKANELRALQEIGTKHVLSALNNNAENIATTQMQNLLANYTAYGGPLYFAGGGGIASRHQGSTIDFENSKFARFFRSLFSSNKGKFSGGKTGGGGSRITPGEVTKYKEEKDTTIIPLPIVLTFNEAFAKARKRGDKTFLFNGKTYNTALGGGKGTYEAGLRRKAIVGIVPDTIIDTRLVPYTEDTWALGGSLFADGGSIHIDPANRGKFTETKRRTGKTTEELTHSKNPITRKRAIFAQNVRKFKHSDGGSLNPYSAESLVNAIYDSSVREEFLGKPSHNYDFTISEEEANKLGYYPDERGHRDDRVKKPTHPTHPSRGKWNSFEEFELTDKGMENPNYTLFGLVDGRQDPQAVMTYKGGVVLPEITVTPKESYIMNPYDNIKIFDKGGSLTNKKSSSRKLNNNYKEGEIYDVTEEEVKLLKELGYEFKYV